MLLIRGVAKAIREYDKSIYEAYSIYCRNNQVDKLLGTVQYFRTKNDKVFANLFAQREYGYTGKQYTDLKALEKCFKTLSDYCDTAALTLTLALPYKIGCVRGGADWSIVSAMIEQIFTDMYVELWRLDKG